MTLRAATTQAGHAFTLDEWRTAHRARTGAVPKGLETCAARLRVRGYVQVVGGRTGTLQYCSADALQPPNPAARDVYTEAADVVVDTCRITDHAVALGEIVRALRSRGIDLSSNQVRDVLEALCTASEDRAVTAHQAARLETLVERGEHWGREHRFWRPVGSGYPVPLNRAPSRAADLRRAVTAAVRQVGVPVSVTEFKTWLRAYEPQFDDRRLAPALRLLIEKPRKDLAGRLVDYSSMGATDGGVPLRFGPAGLDDRSCAAARFIDACYRLRPAAERASCDALRRYAARHRMPALVTLADAREEALRRALTGEMGTSAMGEAARWEDVRERLEHVVRELTAIRTRTVRSKYAQNPRWLVSAEEALAYASTLSGPSGDVARGPRSEDPTPAACAPVLAGHAGLRELGEVTSWLREILDPEGRPFKHPQSYLRQVRRFANPTSGAGPLYDKDHNGFSLLDAGDVFEQLASWTSSGTLGVLLPAATDVMGYAVRDVGLLRRLFEALPTGATRYRNGAVVALAALGDLVEPTLALAGPGDVAGLNAYALALGLTTLPPSERRTRLEALRVRLDSSLVSRLAVLAKRLGAGDTVSAAF